MTEFLTRVEKIYIYRDAGGEQVNYQVLKIWLKKCLKNKTLVELRKDPFSFYLAPLSIKNRSEKISKIANALARIRVRNPEQRSFPEKPANVEFKFELKNLMKEKRASASVYDAYEFMKLIAQLIPKKEKKSFFLHIIVTEQMIASFEPNDRYHLRSSFLGYPCIISTIGLIEAPAKPREFYIKIASGIPKELAIAQLGNRVLKRNDPRLTQVIKCQMLQTLFYQITGNPFCDNPDCMLYNAHWQEELIRSQVNGKLCGTHNKILKNYIRI